MTAATFITNSITSVSSLDTGRIGYFTAWGGSEYGYAYTYTLSGSPPSGVTIGLDSGILSFASVVAAGSYTFNVIATNRVATGTSATFPYTLTVLQGVTSSRTGTQVLHKTYNPDSGTYGTPTGTDYTTVFATMQTAIISDQTTAGDEKLRANIILKRGNTYNVNGASKNSWLTGIQYYDVSPDPAFPSGALPIIGNNSTNLDEYQNGPLSIGAGLAFDHASAKTLCATIATVAAGASTITALSGASNIKAGRWHVVCGNNQQPGGGFPTNCTYIDYVRVVSVVGNTITLDRPLKYRYASDWYEDTSDGNSFGVARIVPWDTGGTGGVVPADPRMTYRGRLTNLNFVGNPNYTSGSLLPDIVYTEAHIDIQFDGCTIPNATPSMCAHVLYNGGTMFASEFDKFIETLIMLGTNTLFPTYDPIANGHVAGLHAATGVQFFLTRLCTHGCVQLSPRQLLAKGSSFDARGDTFLQTPFSTTAQGPLMDYRFMPFNATATKFFSGGQNSGVWTFAGNTLSDPAIIGTNVTWSGNRLFIPTAYAKFTLWEESIYEGMILYQVNTSAFPVVTNWGYVSTLSSPGDGTGIYANVVWVHGTKPTTGNLYPNARGRVLVVDPTTVFTAPCVWADPMFVAEHTAPFGPSYTFPTGYPWPEDGIGVVAAAGTAKAQSQAFGVATITGGTVINAQGTAKSVSKAQGNLTLLNGTGISLHCVSVHAVFP